CTATGRWVEVRLLSPSWTGGLPCTPREAAALFLLLRDRFGARFPEETPTIFNTPARTGLNLWGIAAQAHGMALPDPLPDDLQRLIRSTSGQGRFELFAPPAADALLTAAWQYDGRQMYVACLRDLGSGPATLTAGGCYQYMRPARYQVRFWVPPEWSRGLPGLLPVKVEEERRGKSWWWPAEPGSGPYETWVSDAELRVALWPFAATGCSDCAAGFRGQRGDAPCPLHGWSIRILETLAFTPPAARTPIRRGPLDLWHDRLAAIQREIAPDDEIPLHVRHLAQKALRAILIDTVGAFARGPRRDVSRATMSPAEVPRDADPEVIETPEGLLYVYNERAPFEEDETWMSRFRHPEFSAQVWGRARARMLLAQGTVGQTGLLTLPPSSGIALVSDALYLASDPGWPDDGANGRLRPKVQQPSSGEPFPWPQSDAELRRLRAALVAVEEKPACCRQADEGGQELAGEPEREPEREPECDHRQTREEDER
ncbi:MAG TPA: hypothetical protein VGN32_19940, partial [Ktedonobacterales bacterium]|nr:hypothetical protein [Ktedonobacterales bacterium]